MKRRYLIPLITVLAILFWDFHVTPVGFGFRAPRVLAALVQQPCPSGLIPITGPAWATSNPATGGLIQWGCLDPFGNIMIATDMYIATGSTLGGIQGGINVAGSTGGVTVHIPAGTTFPSTPATSGCTPSTPGIGNNPCQILMPTSGNVKLKFAPGTYTNVGTTGGEFIVNPVGSFNNTVECDGRATTTLRNNVSGTQFTAVYADFGTNNTIKDCTLDSGVNTVRLASVVGNGVTATATCGDAAHTLPCGFAVGQAVYIQLNQVPSGSAFNGGPFTVTGVPNGTVTFASAVNNTGTGGAIANLGNSTSTIFTRMAVKPHLLNLEVKHGIVPVAGGGLGNYAVDMGGGFDADLNDIDFWGGTLDCYSYVTNDGSGTYGSVNSPKVQQLHCHGSPSNGIDWRASGGLVVANAPGGAVENAAGTQATITATAALSTVNLGPGMPVHIIGVTNTAFNGDFTILQASGSSFTVANNAPAPSATSGTGNIGLEIANFVLSNIVTYDNGVKNTGIDDEYGGTILSNLAADGSAITNGAIYNWTSFHNFGSGFRVKGDVHNNTFVINAYDNGYGTAGTVIRDAIALVQGLTIGPHNNAITATGRRGSAVNAFLTDSSTFNNTGTIVTATDTAGTADPVSLGNVNDGFQFLNSPSGSNGVLSIGALNLNLNPLTFDPGSGFLYNRSGTSGIKTGGPFNATSTPGIFTHTGTQQITAHIVQDTVTLAAGTATVTLTGAAIFTNATSYTCIADDDTAIASTNVIQNSGSSITINGTGTDVIRYVCAGN